MNILCNGDASSHPVSRSDAMRPGADRTREAFVLIAAVVVSAFGLVMGLSAIDAGFTATALAGALRYAISGGIGDTPPLATSPDDT